MPESPLGAKELQSCPQFAVLTYLNPIQMTNNTTETLITTMVVLKRALSLIPTTRIAVMTRAIRNAGRLKPISTPKIVGAFSNSLACCTSTGDCAPITSVTLFRNDCVPGTRLGSAATAICRATIFSAVFNAVQWSYASHSGILILNMFSSSIKWFDQPDETVLAPIAYSSVRSQPMIQARSSPKVAYAYV